MIHVTASVGDGHCEVVVDGHETNNEQDGRVCAAVTAVMNAALLGLAGIAEEYPRLVTVDIKEHLT